MTYWFIFSRSYFLEKACNDISRPIFKKNISPFKKWNIYFDSIIFSKCFPHKLMFNVANYKDGKKLKELRNCVSHIIRVRSLFCSTRFCTILHFLPFFFFFFWKTSFLSFCAFFLCQSRCNLHKYLHNQCLYNRCQVLCFCSHLRQRIHVGMDEMYEIAQQAKRRCLEIDEINVQNWWWMKCTKFAAKLAS